ncbi:MAG: hypothetical protein IPM82_03610 [Saprospiraceae bacterium]|nr:hypothetical protein [Saprospiraceae bacterium]
MKNTILVILVLTLFIIAPCCTNSLRKPNCNGCDIQAVVKLGESLDKKELEDIFCSIQPDCIDENVEFSEVANEAIFEALRMNLNYLEVFDKERS